MNNTRYFKLGLFVLAAIALLVAGIIVLGGGLLFKTTISAESVFDESVTGLDVGSPVRYRGVIIGQVKQIGFLGTRRTYTTSAPTTSPRGLIVVDMALDPEKFKPLDADEVKRLFSKMIERGLRVQLTQSAITGSAYLLLDFFEPDSHPPIALEWRPTAEIYFPSAPSVFTQVFGGLEKIIKDLDRVDVAKIAQHIDGLVVNTDRAITDLKVSDARAKMIELVDEVRGTNARIKQILDNPNIDKTVGELPEIAARVKSSMARIDEIVHDKRLEQVISGLAAAADNAGPAAADARRLLRELQTLVDSQSDDIRSIVSNLRSVMENANATAQDLKQNPSRLILGEPPPKTNPGEHP